MKCEIVSVGVYACVSERERGEESRLGVLQNEKEIPGFEIPLCLLLSPLENAVKKKLIMYTTELKSVNHVDLCPFFFYFYLKLFMKTLE